MNQQPPQNNYRFALFLVTLSGAAALGHQLLWTRRLTDLLGASAESSVRVFSGFFLGLGIGAALAAVNAARIRRPFRVLAWVEAGIVLCCLPILFLPQWTDWIWPALGPDALTGPPGGAIKFLLSVLLIVPPAALMGFSFPVLIRGVLGDSLALGRQGINLYAFNTFGGVAGLLLIAGLILQAVGAFASILILMTVNAFLGFVFLRLHRLNHQELDEQPSETDSAAGRTPTWLLAIAFLSGAGVMAAEVAAFKMFTLVATIAFHTPTALLATVILMLAIAAWTIGPLARNAQRLAGYMVISSALAGWCLAWAPVIFMSIVTQHHPYAANPSLFMFMLKFAGVALLSIGPALFLAGMLFPAALKKLGEGGRDAGGRQLGWLLAANGFGGLLGAELTFRWLLPSFGVYQTLGAIGLFYVLVAVGLIGFRSDARGGWTFGAAALCLLGVLSVTFTRLAAMSHINTNVGFDIIEEKNGREGHVAVVEHPAMGRAILVSNQYTLGSEKGKYLQERQAHLPLLLHPDPRRVGFIGHATGMTPGAALLHDAVKDIVSVEIAGSVVEVAADHFGELNYNVARDPRARVLNEDGRTYFSACREAFDVIEADLFLPWGSGVGRLYSREHFESVRKALRPGG
ncbi:MAG: fused MFS/spermidine synthase, partial [Verrucomicrobiota bacterium]